MTKLNLYEYLNQVVDNNVVIGLVCSIVTKESQELFFVGESEANKAVSIDTIYDLASVSKVVGTLSGILKLIEENKLSLNTKVKNILPDYKHESTVLDLLLHQSGLPADDKAYRNAENSDDFKDFVYNLDLVYQPRTKVEYSDFGFNLLGFIIEHFKGNINDFLQEEIFRPLNMHNTTYIPQTLNQELIAPSEIHSDRGVIKAEVMDGKAYKLNGLSGNAGLFSNASDLGLYVQMLLNDGEAFNKQILEKSSIDLLKSNKTEGLNLNRTLGYIINDDSLQKLNLNSDQVIYHTGFSGPMIFVDFKNEFGVVILCNRTYPSRENTQIIEERFTILDNIYKYLNLK